MAKLPASHGGDAAEMDVDYDKIDIRPIGTKERVCKKKRSTRLHKKRKRLTL